MLDFLLYQASKLIAQGVISVPDVLWTGATQEEVEAMESLGFLFENYKVREALGFCLRTARRALKFCCQCMLQRSAAAAFTFTVTAWGLCARSGAVQGRERPSAPMRAMSG
eukprot:904343-Rhodomonas_salina.2